jgi:hypothetical protein
MVPMSDARSSKPKSHSSRRAMIPFVIVGLGGAHF